MPLTCDALSRNATEIINKARRAGRLAKQLVRWIEGGRDIPHSRAIGRRFNALGEALFEIRVLASRYILSYGHEHNSLRDSDADGSVLAAGRRCGNSLPDAPRHCRSNPPPAPRSLALPLARSTQAWLATDGRRAGVSLHDGSQNQVIAPARSPDCRPCFLPIGQRLDGWDDSHN